MAREYVWLWDARHGTSIQEIADREKLSPRRVRLGISRARAQEQSTTGATADAKAIRPPRLTPLFPIAAYVPTSGCAHKGPMPRGTLLCCMICHRSGVDGHPALQRDRATDPKPEAKAPPLSSEPAKPMKETRKQKRARIFGKSANPISDAPITV
jgi:hypothetical protein